MRRLAVVANLSFLCVLIANVLHAQTPPVRTSAADSPFPDISSAQWAKIEGSSGHKFLTAVLRPAATAPSPVVVVLHGALGLNKAVMSVADDVRRAGFLVVVGCWQAGQAQSEGTRLCSEAIPQAEWVADPAARCCAKELIAMARSVPGARTDRLGLYGLSIGGQAALWVASTGANVQAVVADAPPSAKSREVLAGLTAPLLVLQGTADKVVSVDQTREYEGAARALGKPVVAACFEGVGHLASLQPESQAEARKRTITFFQEHLAK
jgi:dienelactone hydrolase